MKSFFSNETYALFVGNCNCFGNRTSCHTIQSVIIHLINHIVLPLQMLSSDFVNHSYNHRPNWTPPIPITIINPCC